MRNESRSHKRRLARVEAGLNVPAEGRPEMELVYYKDLARAQKRARAEGRNVLFLALQHRPEEIVG